MNIDANHQSRLAQEWEAINSLAKANRFFEAREVTPLEDLSDDVSTYRLELKFKGKGIASIGSVPTAIEYADEHIVMLEFPRDFPQQAPKIQVVSILFHPNVPQSGLISTPDIGLVWQPELSSDIVCERIWDVIRGAYWEPEDAVNPAAARWYREHAPRRLPLDPHPLDDPAEKVLNNIVRYSRRDSSAPKHYIAGETVVSKRKDDARSGTQNHPADVHFIE